TMNQNSHSNWINKWGLATRAPAEPADLGLPFNGTEQPFRCLSWVLHAIISKRIIRQRSRNHQSRLIIPLARVADVAQHLQISLPELPSVEAHPL
ncbi:MAG TPA: hypothetical protein PK202_14280, partial [Verrucomicrobiota bacterium]|nr:hypothetical protein [Verrucomicrobiota bacterium]HOX64113.1 hypothetical protein [Verrucomicrobiota bacterium]HPI66458.1 hypothetical protein [Verrucomicrobiota bacterium]HPO44118.1 hypothetical protein [Verrucomicrobiota bacterium]HPW92696.1 hypothetical protein [Verrucomicrobiota bacterium]